MSRNVTLDEPLEAFVSEMILSGRYSSRADVLRAAVQGMLDRDARRAALEDSLASGLADIEAGRFEDIDVVAARLDAKYAAMEKAADAA